MEVAPAQHTVSLDGPVGSGDEPLTLGDRLGLADDNLERVEMQEVLEQVMAHLTPRERKILALRFVEQLPQTEVAKRLGISQMHVSRLAARGSRSPAQRVRHRSARVDFDNLRSTFLCTCAALRSGSDFFASSKSAGIYRLASFPLIPHDDPSLLFTVAGMVPLKPWITGQRTPPSPDLVSCQKCFRGAGLKSTTFRRSVIRRITRFSRCSATGRSVITSRKARSTTRGSSRPQVLGLDPDRLWPSIYPDDVESERLWVEKIGVPRERIVPPDRELVGRRPDRALRVRQRAVLRLGRPLLVRARPTARRRTSAEETAGRSSGTSSSWSSISNPTAPGRCLPNPVVDTGLGFDRIVAIVQDDRTGYATDHFAPIVDGFRSRAGARRSRTRRRVRSLYVLADHVRGAGFLIAAGVLPSNEGRGYVLRRLIRRAAVHARRVAVRGGLAAGTPELVEVMGPIYPELVEHRTLIEETLRIEEDAFARTLDAGTERLAALPRTKRQPHRRRRRIPPL